MNQFQAYEVALQLIRSLRPLIPRLARHDRSLSKHVREAATSVALNLKEGNRREGGDRLQHFRYAAGSADEVQGALDVAEAWGYLPARELAEARALVDRQLALLWRLTHPRGP